ncbi:MAG: hypothetical protein ACRDRN_10330 [Sciscionella sp.]
MLMPPTTTIDVDRGSVLDGFGDEVDAFTRVYDGVPAIIAYQTEVALPPASGRPVQASAYEIVVDSWLEMKDQDVVTDRQTGEQYRVTTVRKLPSYGIPNDLQLIARRIDGT